MIIAWYWYKYLCLVLEVSDFWHPWNEETSSVPNPVAVSRDSGQT